MVTEEEVKYYKELLEGVDLSADPETKWHEFIADILIDIRNRLVNIEQKMK